jgi:hypothetical protein
MSVLFGWIGRSLAFAGVGAGLGVIALPAMRLLA